MFHVPGNAVGKAGRPWRLWARQLVTSAVQRSGVRIQTDAFVNDEIRVTSASVFNPVHWRKTSLQPFYEKRISEMAWANMRHKNTAMHFWNKRATKYTVVQDSLAQRVMRSNCDLCTLAAFENIVNVQRAAAAVRRDDAAAAAVRLSEQVVGDEPIGAMEAELARADNDATNAVTADAGVGTTGDVAGLGDGGLGDGRGVVDGAVEAAVEGAADGHFDAAGGAARAVGDGALARGRCVPRGQ